MLHSLILANSGMSYNQAGMSEPFESYYHDFTQSDLEPKIKDRYWQIDISYRKWLGNGQPDVATGYVKVSPLNSTGG